MVFNSVSFAVFFPAAVLIYYILPESKGHLRKIWLLLCSYYFYMSQGAGYVLLLLVATVITYLTAFWVYKDRFLLTVSLI